MPPMEVFFSTPVGRDWANAQRPSASKAGRVLVRMEYRDGAWPAAGVTLCALMAPAWLACPRPAGSELVLRFQARSWNVSNNCPKAVAALCNPSYNDGCECLRRIQ